MPTFRQFAVAILGLFTVTAQADPWQTSLVSRIGRGDTGNIGSGPSLTNSADGRYVLFDTAANNILAGQYDVNGSTDVFLFDRVEGTTQLVSHAAGNPTATGNGGSSFAGISSDGRWVVFASDARNLVEGIIDTNGGSDAYLFDRVTGTNRLLSHAVGSPNTAANGASGHIAISADGRTVLFHSNATNLVAGVSDTNATFDVFAIDLATDTVQLVSRSRIAADTTPSAASAAIAVSADGSKVLFQSTATDVAGSSSDANGAGTDVYLFDRGAATTTLVSHQAGATGATALAASTGVALSADGNWVLFHSLATDLLSGATDGNSATDVYLYDRVGGGTTLVSHAAGMATTAADAASTATALSADGRFVLFGSRAGDLIAGGSDGNGGAADVFLFDRLAGSSTLVSHAASATATAAGAASSPVALSDDGAWVLFASQATDLVGGLTDSNAQQDVFLYERATGANRLVSRAIGDPGHTANNRANGIVLSADGSIVLFQSYATDVISGLADSNRSSFDVFEFDRNTGATILASRAAAVGDVAGTDVSGTASTAQVNGDGSKVLFNTNATNLIPGAVGSNSARDLLMFDRATGNQTLISHAAGQPRVAANGDTSGGFTADGRYVLMSSAASNLVAGVTKNNGGRDVYLFDIGTGDSALVSRAAGTPLATANGSSSASGASADGRWILFDSVATNVVAGVIDTNLAPDVFLFDRATATTKLLSHAGGLPNQASNATTSSAGISADGRWVLMYGIATDLVAGVADGNGATDIFLFDAQTGESTLVSHSAASTTTTANGNSIPFASLSPYGNVVVFASNATDLVPGAVDGNGSYDIFAWHRDTGVISLVSHTAGSPLQAANASSFPDRISADGRWVLYTTSATDLVSGFVDGNGSGTDVYLYDLATDQTLLVTHVPGQPTHSGNGSSSTSDLGLGRLGGTRATFSSSATDLVPGFVDPQPSSAELFIYDRANDTVILASRSATSPTVAATSLFTPILNGFSSDGSTLVYLSDASNIDPAAVDQNSSTDVYMTFFQDFSFADGFE